MPRSVCRTKEFGGSGPGLNAFPGNPHGTAATGGRPGSPFTSTRGLAGRERQQGEPGPGVGDVVGLVVVQRPGEPAARGALVRTEPVGPPAQGGVVGRDARLAE